MPSIKVKQSAGEVAQFEVEGRKYSLRLDEDAKAEVDVRGETYTITGKAKKEAKPEVNDVPEPKEA